ncbi:hypothetical protein M407DRAFT_243792 [Tulasnella calospora MUT 4182]|uniref:ATP-dependent (S)-NAD(P)H-hydrate dehydratase n=1 Tax=Tulasnella calospora MUT 4182 TaxID=1051891 RepID=A0A0C3QHS5_9AGAM|nr:hypothetical protein M407DRAFT_243792 [Tulasnella calospora MUT 4182]
MASRGLLDQVKLIIPPLNGKLHKGQAGRVGVVGGSADYTGAPFFSAISALRVGADLSHVICEPGAGSVIKTYSPDLIVHPIIQEDSTPESVKSQMEGLLERLHIIVVGPGLGREERTQSIGRMAIEVAKAQEKYVVLDADGLWLIQNEPHLVKDYKRAILTPNVVEFKRLCDSMKVPKDSPPEELASRLAKAFGNVTIVQKGQQDIISNGERTEVVDIEGGLKRVGGQGDILSGTVGTFVAWGKNYEEQNLKGSNDSNLKLQDIPLLAAIGACHITRTASRLAFQKHGRGVLTSDMLVEIGPAYSELFGDLGEKGLKGNL